MTVPPKGPPTLGSRYTIERELGRGGMATVYLANDRTHDRQVAVKVLRPELAAALGPERFLREVRITARLNHPHILPLLDSGEADGSLYYVMPYVEGESLRQRLDRERQLPLDDAVRITCEVADALAYAHSHDVVHRDVKPENILLSGGHAVVADFGIARAVTAAGGDRLTDTGVAIGTPAYMSPEQSTGGASLDGRSDIYALGCVAYEMLAGAPPYTGPSPQAIILRRLSEPAPRLSAARETVPPRIENAIMTALAKVPADRYATAAQFAEALAAASAAVRAQAPPIRAVRRRWPVVAAALGAAVVVLVLGFHALNGPGSGNEAASGAVPRVAVLPFENLGASDDDYFADGLTEELTSRLARLSGLAVIARTSAIQYRGTTLSAREIGRELAVQYLLEGTVRWARAPDGSSRVRVTPQLIRASDESHVWTEVYEEELASVFDLQSRIGERVAQALNVAILTGDRRTLARRPTENLAAYDAYLRGLSATSRQGQLEHFAQAVTEDPDFALAQARLAIAHAEAFYQRDDRSEARLTMAREAVERALAGDPDLPEAHAALGFYHLLGRADPTRALPPFERAVALDPRNAVALAGMANVLRRLGRVEESLGRLERALALDPRNYQSTWVRAATLASLKRYPEADRAYDRAIALAPSAPSTYGWKAMLYLSWTGDVRAARDAMQRAPQALSATWGVRGILFRVMSDTALRHTLDSQTEALRRQAASDPLVEPRARRAAHFLVQAELYRRQQDRAREHAAYDSARAIFEAVVAERPDDADMRSGLGIAYAGLGRAADAIREGRRGVELFPATEDLFYNGPNRIQSLAEIYVMLGQHDQAVEQLRRLLALDGLWTPALVQADPVWEPLREHPQYRALVAGRVGR